jgi:cytoskeletal protein CcmA (bactofilin family)
MNDPKNATAAKRTLVEEGTKLKGSLTSSCAIVVQGTVEGDVEGPSVSVSPTGALSGTIIAAELMSAGKISGDFDVDSARVEGAVESDTVIHAASLDLKLTAASGKKLQLSFGQVGGPRGRS